MPTFKPKKFNPSPKEPRHARKIHKEYYTKRWRRLRLKVLADCPYCVQCWRDKTQYVLATVVDHIIDHNGDQILMWSMSNLQSLCKKCHDRKSGYSLAEKNKVNREKRQR